MFLIRLSVGGCPRLLNSSAARTLAETTIAQKSPQNARFLLVRSCVYSALPVESAFFYFGGDCCGGIVGYETSHLSALDTGASQRYPLCPGQKQHRSQNANHRRKNRPDGKVPRLLPFLLGRPRRQALA